MKTLVNTFLLIIFNMLFLIFRCKDESLQSVRKGLLRALNLQAEPQLPAGGIDSIREQWQRTIGFIPQAAKKTART